MQDPIGSWFCMESTVRLTSTRAAFAPGPAGIAAQTTRLQSLGRRFRAESDTVRRRREPTRYSGARFVGCVSMWVLPQSRAAPSDRRRSARRGERVLLPRGLDPEVPAANGGGWQARPDQCKPHEVVGVMRRGSSSGDSANGCPSPRWCTPSHATFATFACMPASLMEHRWPRPMRRPALLPPGSPPRIRPRTELERAGR